MRVNPEPIQQHLAARRRSAWILGVLASLAIAVVVIEGLASFYVDYLWFGSAHVGVVWRAIVTSKLGLAGVFVVIATAMVWASLWLADKIAQRTLFLPSESELVRRYHSAVVPHAFVLRTAISLIIGLGLGTGTSSQWQHWLLFRHAFSFGITDPEFHRDASFYVFRLPFLSFLVDWLLVALLVTFLVSVVAHFLNGTIRLQGPAHVEPRAIAHLSLLLGVMAVVRAWGYYYVDRFALEVPHDGGVPAGATYTGVSVRLPALTLLAVIALIAFVMLVINVYQRTLLLPVLAFGLWALVALAIDVIYPAVESAVAATPEQDSHAAAYAVANVRMTRTGMGISKVAAIPFPANRDLNSAVLSQYTQSLHDVTLWDPSEATAVLSQGSTSYDLLSGLTENRYVIDGTLDPVLIGARQLDDGQLPSQDWTSLHVTYTHGYGAVVAAGDRATADGSPVAEVGGLPPASLAGAPSLGKAGSRVYFSPAGRQFVLVDTTEPEIDYEIEGTTQTAPPYSGGATIGVGAFLPRLAFAVKLHDFNLLVSDVVKPTTRVIYLTGTRQRVQKALPFMKVDADPYAVIAGNQLYWLYSAYVTSAYFPDATPADTSMLPAGSGLRGSYDYVRDAVVAVINARTGSMGFYDVDNDADPLLESYEASFPGLIQSTAALRQLAGGQIYGHLRYPQDLLTVQAATYGAYRPTAAGGPAGQAATQPSAGASWSLADSGNAGTPGAATTPYQPQYELVQWQPDQEPTFSLVQPLVSYAGPSGTGGDQMLTGLFVANSSPEHYGQLTVREVDSTNVPGPYVANEMLAKDDTELGDLAVGGNDVLGTIELLPVADSLLYVRPLYASVAGGDPVLEDVIVVYGKQVVIAPSVDAALSRIVHGGSGSVSPERPSAGELAVARTIRRDLEQAAADLSRAQHQLAERHLGAYQQDVDSAQQLIDAANRLEGSGAVPVAAAAAPTTRSTTRRGLLAGSGRPGGGSGPPGGGSGPPGGGSGRSGGGSGRSGEGAGSTASGRPARTAARIPENASSRAGTAAGGAGTTGATSTSTTSALGGSTPTSEPATTLPGVPAATQASGGARRPAGATSPAGGGTGAPAAGLRDAPATTATTVVTSSAGPAPGSTSTAPPTSTSGPSASSTFTSTVPGSGRA